MIKKLYCFYWSEYEGYSPHNLIHEINKTQEEFESDCKKALIDSFEEYRLQEQGWIGIDSMISFAVEYMIKNMGYARPEEISYGFFNSMIIRGECFEEGKMREDDQAVLEVVGQDIFNKILDHNNEIENSIYDKDKEVK